MQLTIHNPCQENWAEMSPTEQGKFCAACQKEVQDFTSFSFLEIKQFFEVVTGPICGHFNQQQLRSFNTLYQPLPTPSRIQQWAAAAVLTAVITLPSFGQLPSAKQAKPILPLPSPIQRLLILP
ncbi:MAG: hypothetical protein ACRBFS_27120 [Aureispira sp.]